MIIAIDGPAASGRAHWPSDWRRITDYRTSTPAYSTALWRWRCWIGVMISLISLPPPQQRKA